MGGQGFLPRSGDWGRGAAGKRLFHVLITSRKCNCHQLIAVRDFGAFPPRVWLCFFVLLGPPPPPGTCRCRCAVPWELALRCLKTRYPCGPARPSASFGAR